MNTVNTLRRSTVLAILLAGACMPAYAQEANDAAGVGAPEPSPTPDTLGSDGLQVQRTTAGGSAPTDSTSGLEDIVVTATRREERLQDVPVTVTAITSQSLASADVSTTRTLTQVIPGFIGGRNMGVAQPVIRGVSSTGTSVGDEPNVATYIDGVYQPESAANWIDLVEVDRVEVLRGPQGTVFGRNATGGLVNVITPDPKFDFSGKVSARYGRMRNEANDYDLRAYFTGGLTEKIAADFAGLFRKNDGYIKDLVNGGEVGDQRVIDVRSKLLFQPSDTAKIVLTGEYFDQSSTTNAPQTLRGNAFGKRFPGVILPTGAWQASLSYEPVLDLHRWNAALRTQFQFENFNLETTTGYLNLRWVQDTDLDATNIALASIPAVFRSESISQEIRLLSTGSGRFQWIVGGYFFQWGGSSTLDVIQRTSPTVPFVTTRFEPELDGRSFAGFAEGTYELASSLFLTLGGRYTTEKRSFEQVLNGVNLFGKVSNTVKKWTYRAAVRYNFADDANIYASYGTGFKSGVYNMLGPSPIPVKPETIEAAEVGIKADPLDWLRTNLSIYRYDYKNLQLVSRAENGSFVLQNAATAEIYGGEFEVTIAPSRDLNLRGSTAYSHARYSDFPAAQSFFPLPLGGNQVTAADASGNVMTRAPKWTFSVGADWGHDFEAGRLGASLNVFHSTKVYYDFQNIFFQKAYTLLNGSVSWATNDELWKLTLAVSNITNAKVLQTMRVGGLGTDGFYEPPRKIAIGIERKF